MSGARWDRIKEIVSASLDLQEPERSAYVSEQCGEDSDLHGEVQSLIASYEEAEGFLDKPVIPELPDRAMTLLEQGVAPHVAGGDARLGQRLGPYRIVELLGSGGMGVVYRAVREDGDFSMNVAIKLVKRGMDSDLILRRFRRERQILARLNHPNIARLLDGGVTHEGLPFFVMEFIAGTPLDDYLRRNKLPLDQRLDMFLAVAAAVGYAHQNLVVHSDLKASNIMISKEGVPKLLDFGIARLVDPETEDQTQRTGAFRAVTPAYASPEHLRGDPVTVASDVYSLGVLFYEMLTGERPFGVEMRTPQQALAVIESMEPRRASAVSGDGSVAGDLDNIARKALDREPSRRYATVEQFADDVRRYVEGLPVLARPSTVTYRLSKFIRRHRFQAAAVALLLLSLVAGAATTAWQARQAQLQRERAERRYNDLRRLATSLMYEMDEALVGVPGAIHVRAKLMERSLAYLDSLNRDSATDDTLRAELAAAYEKMGDLQGQQGESNLGNTAAALESYRKALSIREELATRNPRDPKRKQDYADITQRIAGVFKVAGQYREGLDMDQKALRIREQLLEADPANLDLLRSYARNLTTMGGSYSHLGDWTAVLDYRRRALDYHQRLAGLPGATKQDRHGLALANIRMSSIHVKLRGYEAALTYARQALSIESDIEHSNPNNRVDRLALAYAQSSLAYALVESGSANEGIAWYRTSMRIFDEIIAADPADERAESLRATAHARLGLALIAKGEADEALALMRKALQERIAISGANPANIGARAEVAEVYGWLGDVLSAAGKRSDARAAYVEALRIFEQMDRNGQLNATHREAYDRVKKSGAVANPSGS